mgnify:CR=1 FL=1
MPSTTALEQTVTSLLYLIQQHGDPHLVEGASNIMGAYGELKDAQMEQHIERVLRGKGPVADLKRRLGLSQRKPVDKIARGQNNGNPGINEVRALIASRLHPSVRKGYYGSWNPLDVDPKQLTPPPDTIDALEDRIYEIPTPPGRRKVLISVVVNRYNVLTMEFGVDYLHYIPRVTLNTFDPLEGEWLTHQHTEILSRGDYSKALYRLMKAHGHDGLTHPLPIEALLVTLEKNPPKEDVNKTLTVKSGTESVDYQMTHSVEDSSTRFVKRGVEVKWEELDGPTQRTFLSYLQD